jgi:glucosamine--fructose-6-phosphate aminotransferase (isomerizing)
MKLLMFQRTILFQKLLEVQINSRPKMTTDKVVTGVLMLGEMLEQPKVLADSIKLWDQDISAICSILPEKIQGVVFIGRGSSDNAATIGRYAVEAFTGIPASLAAPSLSTRYAPHTSYVDYVIVAMSQSGGTPEVIAAASALKGKGSKIIAITNSEDSSLARIADLHIDLQAGVEKAVPATKTVTAQVLAVLKIASALAKKKGLDSPISQDELMRLPEAVKEVLNDFNSAERIVSQCLSANRLQLIGRGLVYGAVLEAAIKIKETSGVFAHGISSADFVHGPIAAVDNELPVIIFDAGGVNSEELSNLNIRLQKMGITTYTSSLDPKCSIPLPLGFSEILNSIPIIIRGQQLSYSWAIALGKDPDSPMGLSKMTLTY